MANFNKVILVGNLTRDPQLSFLPSNTPVVEFGLAINRRWRGQNGEMREETCFVDCRAYGRSAETINQYMSKGGPLLVEGRLQFQQYAKITIRVVRINRLLYQFARSSSNGHGYSELLSGGQSKVQVLA